jgi:4-carboxymuconolactone decarboxylase
MIIRFPNPAVALGCGPDGSSAAREIELFPPLAGLGTHRPRALLAALARHPALAQRMTALARMLVTEGLLPERQRELVILRVAWRVSSEYLWGGHVQIALGAGVSAEEIARIAAGAIDGGWSGMDRRALAACDELLDAGRVTRMTRNAILKHWDARQLLELVAVVGQYRLLAAIAESFGLAPEPGLPSLQGKVA